MQPTGGGGLTRFRSAPATWLEALLESEEETDVVLDPPLPPPPPLAASKPPQPPQSLARYNSVDLGMFETHVGGGGGGLTGFLRQNSSPAEFLSLIGSEGYFGDFNLPSGFDYVSTSSAGGGDGGPQLAKRARDDSDLEKSSAKFSSSQVKGEQSDEQHGGASGLLDADMEKLLEDSVPCRVRAKRGCATHPRSIAERVRRTRISDRIRKLQELVPNMDKQTNTADMLEEAVEYVKFLQKQIQELTEHQKKCKCMIKE